MTSRKLPGLPLCILVLTFMALHGSAQQQFPPLSPEDLLKTRRVSAVSVSPSGAQKNHVPSLQGKFGSAPPSRLRMGA
jgi:hypothetical protein